MFLHHSLFPLSQCDLFYDVVRLDGPGFGQGVGIGVGIGLAVMVIVLVIIFISQDLTKRQAVECRLKFLNGVEV